MNVLLDEVLTNVEEREDYLQLFFAGGAILNIYNAHRIDGCNSIRDLANAFVVGVRENESSLILNFGDRGQLTVDLPAEAFSGPEAMQLHQPGSGPVIWT